MIDGHSSLYIGTQSSPIINMLSKASQVIAFHYICNWSSIQIDMILKPQFRVVFQERPHFYCISQTLKKWSNLQKSNLCTIRPLLSPPPVFEIIKCLLDSKCILWWWFFFSYQSTRLESWPSGGSCHI